jgi:protein-export membrane protein SecD
MEGHMLQTTQVKLIAVILLTLVAAFVAVPFPKKPRIPIFSDAKLHLGIDLAGGAELRYKVLYDSGFPADKREATRKATDIIRKRLEAKELKEAKVTAQGEADIVIQLPGVDADGLTEYKRLIEPMGSLELHALAPENLQERYQKDNVIPEGYQVVKNTDGTSLLIQERAVIEGRHITNAQAHQETGPGEFQWVTSFELDAEGATLFDEAAEKLYRERPRGKIVIIFDGKVKSAPTVQSPSFHGRGQISGAKSRTEAEDLSIILRSGGLPAPLGSTPDEKNGRR